VVVASAITLSQSTRLKAAMAVAVLADVVQIALFPIFAEGAASPADDLLDVGVAGVLSFLVGWHWEFMPSFAAKLVPGVDFIPLWSLAVANVYRKSRRDGVAPNATATKPNPTVIEGEPVRSPRS
jgi:hypothetical protein